jgi:uncharacterized protein YndB with AHSA1/START domain
MDDVFRALADPTRRALLDRLFARDGQTLGELCAGHAMTRQAASKHLRILEEANLVAVHWAGREKLHYLNPVPIRALADRWIDKYAQPWARALVDLGAELSEPPMTKPNHVYVTYIKTTDRALWDAITQGEHTRRYFYGTAIRSTWKAGAAIAYLDEHGNEMVTGAVVEVDPPRRLVMTWRSLYDAEVAADPPSRVTWTLEPQGPVVKLTLVHEFEAPCATSDNVREGWHLVLDGLKTLLETGEPLPAPVAP